jgi:hypothetical protein
MWRGCTTTDIPRPRPELDGLLLVNRKDESLYLVLDGVRRRIPDSEHFWTLFRPTACITDLATLPELPEGAAFSGTEELAQNSRGRVFLVVDGHKRHVLNPLVMDQFSFSWQKCMLVPDEILESMPTGPTIGPREEAG